MEDVFEDEYQRSPKGSFNLKYFLTKLLANYVVILLTMLIALLGAYIYLRYSTPKYRISSYILVGGGELESNANSILTNVGLISSVDNTLASVNNEIFILKSHAINGKVVDSLQLNVIVSKIGRFNNQPIIKDNLPVNFHVRKSNLNNNSPEYGLTLNEEGFIIDDNGESIKGFYGKPLILNSDTITFNKKSGATINDDTYLFQLTGRSQTIAKYISQLGVEATKNGGVGLLKLSVVEEVPEIAEKYIQVLIHSYNESYLDYKNQAIRRALTFLNQRLETIGSELNAQEQEIGEFKARNKLYDISTTAAELLMKLQDLDDQKSQYTFQNELLLMIQSSMQNASDNEEIIATNNGLSDPVLLSQVQQYNELVLRKQMIQTTGAKSDPRLGIVNEQLANVRSNTLLNIANIRKQFQASNNHLSSLENSQNNEFNTLPEKEKEFVELHRKVSIKEAQYLFLLQKKEETDIQLVSSDSERSRTVDDVLNEGKVWPITLDIYGIALMIGLLFPCFIILLRVLLNQKIETREEIEHAINIPILGELSLSQSDDPIVISKNNRSAIAEQFRAIRSNLSFMENTETHKVFLVSSCIGGEGKSFVSLNLGNSLALSEKRVAILELDLRKPILSEKLGVENKLGITSFIINKTMHPSEIIHPLKEYPNLFLLGSGPIPPNPGELIIHPRVTELIIYLKDNFDYVILDTPPFGLVADALNLAALSDLSIFVIRPDHSLRSSLTLLNDLYKDKKFPNLSVIVNGIRPRKGYGYGYGHGYGYGYYSEDVIKKENSLIKFFKRLLRIT
jgi:tyrosine-protein kinase Etk/Wzc